MNHTILKDIEYFHKNLSLSNTNQIVNYTWEKPSNESPSTYKKIEEVKVNGSVATSTYQNTLDIMAPYKGIPHSVKQNKWETDPSDPPKFLPYPQHRRTANQSAMTQLVFLTIIFKLYFSRLIYHIYFRYDEEMNKAFPGESMY